jgi:hypothetical protein
MHTERFVGKSEGKHHSEDLDVDGMVGNLKESTTRKTLV